MDLEQTAILALVINALGLLYFSALGTLALFSAFRVLKMLQDERGPRVAGGRDLKALEDKLQRLEAKHDELLAQLVQAL